MKNFVLITIASLLLVVAWACVKSIPSALNNALMAGMPAPTVPVAQPQPLTYEQSQRDMQRNLGPAMQAQREQQRAQDLQVQQDRAAAAQFRMR